MIEILEFNRNTLNKDREGSQRDAMFIQYLII